MLSANQSFMKKFFKITGILIALFILVFFSFGLFDPEVTYSTDILINKPVAETYRKYNDPGTLKQWIPGMKSLEIIDIKPGMVGTRMKMIIENEGRKVEILEEVVAYEENKTLGLKLDAGIMTKTDYIEFSESGTSTVMKATYTCKGSNLFYKSLFSMFSGYLKSIDENYLKNFKSFVER